MGCVSYADYIRVFLCVYSFPQLCCPTGLNIICRWTESGVVPYVEVNTVHGHDIISLQSSGIYLMSYVVCVCVPERGQRMLCGGVFCDFSLCMLSLLGVVDFVHILWTKRMA